MCVALSCCVWNKGFVMIKMTDEQCIFMTETLRERPGITANDLRRLLKDKFVLSAVQSEKVINEWMEKDWRIVR